MKPSLEIISENINKFIENKGKPKLYFGQWEDARALHPLTAKYGGAFVKLIPIPSTPGRTSEGAKNIRHISENFLRGTLGFPDYIGLQSSGKIRGFFHKLNWKLCGSPTFEKYVSQMEKQESEDMKFNIDVQPPLRYSLAFRYYLSFLRPFLDNSNSWQYAKPLFELKPLLDTIPSELGDITTEEFFSSMPKGIIL